MRVSAAILALVLGSSVAFAQGDPRANPPPVEQPKPEAKKDAKKETKAAKPKAKKEASSDKPKDEASAKPKKPAKEAKETKPASTNGSAPANAALKPSGLADAYAGIPAADRLAIQNDLTWGGDYSGPIDGEFSERLVAAVKAYQTRHKNPATGVLTADERSALAAAVEPRKESVGWRLADDAISGVRLGVPTKFAPKITRLQNGTRWSSEQGQLQIEAVRIDTGATLEGVFEQQKKIARRRIQSSALQDSTFVISGMQGLKKMQVRGAAKDGEVRILTILYDQAMEGTGDPLVAPLTSAFVPFPVSGFALAGAAQVPGRKVGYGSGLIVSANGHVVTDRNLIDNCNVIAVSGVGNAERVATDVSGEVALLRVYGARNLAPIGMIGSQPTGSAVTLVGVADPQAQAGGSAVSAVKAAIGPDASTRRLESAPSPGFSGAAALNEQGQLAGLVVLKAPVVAGTGKAAAAAPQAGVVPVDRIRNFLEANYVAPASGKPGVEDAKASVVRVICIRK